MTTQWSGSFRRCWSWPGPRGMRAFDMFAVNHSYLRLPLRMLQPVPLLARLAPETGDMALLTGIFLLALHNPIEVAEQTATLDVITGGRFVFGVWGRGWASPLGCLWG